MKTEVLRLEHIFEPPYLSDFSMDIYASEIVGLVTIDYIGLNYLFDILQNNTSIKYGRVFYNGKLVNNQNNTHKKNNKIILISEKKLLIDNLSVAENLFVIRSGYKKKYINIKQLRLQTKKVFEELGVFIEPSLYVQSLSIYEKTVLEITKAFVSGANLVLLDNLSTFLTEEEVNKIMSLAKKLMQEKKMSFVFICNHHQEAFYFCGRCFLMKKGKIIKCLDVEQKKNFVIEKYSYEFISWVRNSKHENLYKSNIEQDKGGFSFKTKDFSFSIKKGEAIVLLDSDSRLINQLFTMMNNIKDFPDAEFMVEGQRINKNNSKIMIIPSNPTEKLLFPQLSVIDNICFTLDSKIKDLWLNNKKRKVIANDLYPIFKENIFSNSLYGLDDNLLYDIVYQRILLQKPSFVCVMQPFAFADMMMRIRLIKYFDMLKEKGITVCILAFALSDYLEIASRLLVIKDSKIVKEYKRDDFSSFPGISGSRPV